MIYFNKKKLYSILFFIALLTNLEGRIKVGIDVLEESEFRCLQGKRVGLLTHPAGVNCEGRSTLDILWSSPKVKLVALYGPEHGIYGNEKAERNVSDNIDEKTKLPVYSLYGEHRRPNIEMLKGIDIMVIDLQDIGARTYTYVSCMCYTMEECFKNNIEVIVLDRPNPLGGLKVDGPILAKEWKSYVGVFPVPYVHGLTIGELARIAKLEDDWLAISKEIREKGKLTVVAMNGWKRGMRWKDTGLKWVQTSPSINTVEAVEGYPMTGLLGCGIGGFQNGCGTTYPFRFIACTNKDATNLEKILKKKNISGISFKKQNSINKTTGQKMEGLYVTITDFNAWKPTELNFQLMQLSCLLRSQNPFTQAAESTINLFNKHIGTSEWHNALANSGANANLHYFLTKWEKDSKDFQNWSKKYWMYRD